MVRYNIVESLRLERPLRSSSPTTNPTLPGAPLNHVPKPGMAEAGRANSVWASVGQFNIIQLQELRENRGTLCPELVSGWPQLGCWDGVTPAHSCLTQAGHSSNPSLSRAAEQPVLHPCSPWLSAKHRTAKLHHPARFPALLTPCAANSAGVALIHWSFPGADCALTQESWGLNSSTPPGAKMNRRPLLMCSILWG